MRILIVDDDPFAGQVAAAILEELGHDTMLCENAPDAVGQLGEGGNVDLIVCDMNMPLISGIELFRELRAQDCRIPFVLLSGDDPAGLLAAEPGLDACVLKDGDLDNNLARAVERIARSRAA